MSKHRNYVFTVNFKDGVRPILGTHSHIDYICYQHERGENGTDHLQGYVELSTPVSLVWLKRNINNEAHWEPRAGTAKQARDYAMKEDTRIDGPWEIGVWREKRPGKRTDLDDLRELIVNNTPLDEIIRSGPSCAVKLSRQLRESRAILAPRRKAVTDIDVRCYFGEAGAGKTRQAWLDSALHDPDHPDPYVKAADNKWWDGYDAHKAVLVDDYGGRGSVFPICYHLTLTDIYPLHTLEVKGGHVSANFTLIIFTSNLPPSEWFPEATPDRLQAVIRRFKKIVYFGADPILQIMYPQ
ncbi:MAG: hypothetical protein ACK5VI_10995 [Opitutia bacterium]